MDTPLDSGEAAYAERHRCEGCGCIYDAERGEPRGAVPPGTSFFDVPDRWTCPICGLGKESFSEL